MIDGKRHHLMLFVAGLVLVASAADSAQAQRRRRSKELPTPVAMAIKENFPNATIRSVGRERERQVRYYEVNLRYKGKRIEVEVAPDGSIGEVEGNVATEDVPASVMTALRKKIGSRRIVKIEKHERWGKGRDGRFVPLDQPRISYEAKYVDGGRRRETKIRYHPAEALTSKAKITVQALYPGLQIRDAQLMRIEGVKLFAVLFADGVKVKRLRVSSEGEMIETSDDVETSAIPPAVTAAVKKAQRSAQVIGLEHAQVTADLANGKVVPLDESREIYRVHLLQGKKTAEAMVSLDGEVLYQSPWHEVDGDDDDDDEDDEDDDEDDEDDDDD